MTATPYPIVQGVRVDEPAEETISTDDMRAVEIRAALSRAQVMERMQQNPMASGKMKLVFNFLSGILIPVLALYGYYSTLLPSGEEAPCDKPVAPWLWTYGAVGLFLGIVVLLMDLKSVELGAQAEEVAAELRRQERSSHGADVDAEEQAMAQARVAMPVVAGAGAMGCLGCCCALPMGIFLTFWWIKGNFDVWGTYPREAISWDESMATFRGCDPSLHSAASRVLLITYLLGAMTLSGVCCACGLAVAALSAEEDSHGGTAGAARGRRVDREMM